MQDYHYTESGLGNVWLASGFRIVKSERGESLVIEDIEGLHVAIGRGVVEEEKKLTGPEIRFLRTELLLSQNALSQLLGVTEQTVARWEKGKIPIPSPPTQPSGSCIWSTSAGRGIRSCSAGLRTSSTASSRNSRLRGSASIGTWPRRREAKGVMALPAHNAPSWGASEPR